MASYPGCHRGCGSDHRSILHLRYDVRQPPCYPALAYGYQASNVHPAAHPRNRICIALRDPHRLRAAALAVEVTCDLLSRTETDLSRWDGLFADLEAQSAALELGERAAEIEERTRSEAARLTIIDRLRPMVGAPLRIRCGQGLSISGQLRHVGSEWVLLDEGFGREAVVVLSSMHVVSGLGRLSTAPDSMPRVESRLGISHVLRGLARDRSSLRAHLVDGSVLDGTIDRLGADFVEMAAHPSGELRRRGAVREMVLVAVGSLVALRRDA